MTIYNFNIGIGWASSGVEYAQAYRSNLFKKNKQKAKFIFTDMFHVNIQPMTKNIGFEDDEVIWLYQYFTDVKVSPTTFTLKDLEAEFSSKITEKNKTEQIATYYFAENNLRIAAFFTKDNKGQEKVYKTETIVSGKLIQRDYYTYVRTFSEYFKPHNGSANLYQRRFFNEDGSMAYDELLNGKQSLYVFEDRTIYSREELIGYFMEKLNLNAKDLIIIDRSTGMGPQIIKGKGQAKVGVVIHAEHFNEPLTTKEKILWNNYYDYQFENAKVIDFFVTATQKQKEILEKQFKEYNKGKIKVFTIPVGSIDELKKKIKRNEYALITASRLASEKHLDWMIKAVVKAKKEIPQLTLDIYGEGGEKGMLQKLIYELGAQDFIQLKGQHKLDEVYKNYGTYVSASTSEGFGLTLLEAVGSGNRMIGFDVRYGNQTFIKDGENGILIDYVKNDNDLNILKMSEAIVDIYKQNNKKLEDMRKVSYEIAHPYLTKNIQKSWLVLEEEVTHA